MHCIDDGDTGSSEPARMQRPARPLIRAALIATTLWLGSCTGLAPPPPPASPPAPPAPSPAEPAPPPISTPAPTTSTPGPTPAPPAGPVVPRVVKLPPPRNARNWDEFRLQAAQRLVQAQPDSIYLGPVPEPLLAIPVLEVELNGDGSVRRVTVVRHPTQARDTTQIAIDAVHRAAPYGAMHALSRPWKWTEVFLFDEQRRFKPRMLDVD